MPATRRAHPLLARRSHPCMGPARAHFGPAPPSSGALLFSKQRQRLSRGTCLENGSIRLTFPRAQRMAGTQVGALLEGRGTIIFSLVDETPHRTLLPRSRRPPTRIAAEPSSLGLDPTANGVSSSLVRLPHFHKAPSSDGASFFRAFHPSDCRRARPCKCAWVGFVLRVCDRCDRGA